MAPFTLPLILHHLGRLQVGPFPDPDDLQR